ncbi:MAG: DNA repair exonuclease [Myxococcaceae bacterium]
MALTLIHTADWHLGKRFPGFTESQQTTLSRARLDVLDKVFGEADKCGADAVLCAGDLFDEPNPSSQWWEGLASRLGRTNPTRPVFLLPGNHDPLTPTSVWAATHPMRSRLPKHCHVVDRRNQEFVLGPNAVLYASPCLSAAGQEDLALALPRREPGDGRIRIGLVHGSTFDMPNHQANFPIARDAATRGGFDYLAIGDTHAFRVMPDDGSPPIVYPSAPEATNFGEKDTGFVALVLVRTSRKVRVERAPVATWTWETCRVQSIDELRALANRRDLSHRVMRLAVDIRLGPKEYEEAEKLLEKLSGTEASQPLVGILTIDGRPSLDTRDIEAVFAEMPDAVRAAAALLVKQQLTSPAAVERALFHLYELSRGS